MQSRTPSHEFVVPHRVPPLLSALHPGVASPYTPRRGHQSNSETQGAVVAPVEHAGVATKKRLGGDPTVSWLVQGQRGQTYEDEIDIGAAR